jgi:hypothetical protein
MQESYVPIGQGIIGKIGKKVEPGMKAAFLWGAELLQRLKEHFVLGGYSLT